MAKTIKAKSCELQDVQAAVDLAGTGDTVTVPKGVATWNGGITLANKNIIIKGAGTGVRGTKLIYAGINHCFFSIEAGDNDAPAEISGFYFQGGNQEQWFGTGIIFFGPVGWKGIRIHHNVFDSNKQWSIRGSAATCGLIDHNTFKGSAHGILLNGNGDADWTAPLHLGTDAFFFIESNKFVWNDWYGVTGAGCCDIYDGGRVVFRNNTVENGFFETHDLVRNGMPSANAWEVYRNKLSCASPKWKAMDISSGTGVIWNNTITGQWNVPIGAIDYKSSDNRGTPPCDGNDPNDQNTPGQSGWLCQYQIGSENFGKNAVSSPAYVWGNRRDGKPVGMVCTAGQHHVVDGRDFINKRKPKYAPFQYPHPLTRKPA